MPCQEAPSGYLIETLTRKGFAKRETAAEKDVQRDDNQNNKGHYREFRVIFRKVARKIGERSQNQENRPKMAND